jgi:predicted nucleotide-binding protein
MEKTKYYRRTKLDPDAFYEVDKALKSLASKTVQYVTLDVDAADARWSFNTLEEFLAAADQGWAWYLAEGPGGKVRVCVSPIERGVYRVAVRAPTREEIESVFAVFEQNAERCRLPEQAEKQKQEAKVFIGHGQDPQWRDLKDHLREKHGYAVEAYEVGSRAGHTIRDILEEMLGESSFALLVMTGEDETKEGRLLARQNVVHEAGLFQGKLGFGRAIILLEDGTEEFSNIHGLQQIRFGKGNIKECFGDVAAVLKRELG